VSGIGDLLEFEKQTQDLLVRVDAAFSLNLDDCQIVHEGGNVRWLLPYLMAVSPFARSRILGHWINDRLHLDTDDAGMEQLAELILDWLTETGR
jgi:hypothetical protein